MAKADRAAVVPPPPNATCGDRSHAAKADEGRARVTALAREIYLAKVIAPLGMTPEHLATESFKLSEAFWTVADGR